MKNFLSLIFVLITGIAFSQIVKVSNSVTKVKPDVYAVKFQIERGTLDKDLPYPINTFFKITCVVPENLNLVGIDAHGGIFDFTNDTLTYTWYSLPKEDFIEVFFKAKTSPFDDLPVKLTGTYYYLVNEEKQIFEFPTINLE
jgi:hypothetical protein